MNSLSVMAIGGAVVVGLAMPAMAGPLHDAARTGDGALMQQLLREGADINEQDESGETALFAAAQAGLYSVHDQLLVAGADASIRNNQGFTPLHAAVTGGDAGPMAGLLGIDHRSARIDINDHDNDLGVTALGLAVEANKGEIAAYLVSNGADPNIANKAGLTPVTVAGQKGYDLMVNMLLRMGGNCQDIDPEWKVECDARRTELGL